MGLLVDGVWKDQWYDTKSTGGRFERQRQVFRDWVTTDGEPPGAADGADRPADPEIRERRGFRAEAGRYHLYVSYACPWAHRTLIMRTLKGLEQMIGVSVVHWHMGSEGWTFDAGPGVVPDPVCNATRLYQLYQRANPAFTGRVTVPVLWDRHTDTIVNNESSEVLRMLGRAFDALGATPGDYYPEPLRDEIDAVNARIYDTLNNGVYKAGFATSQEAYEEAVFPLFDTLDWLEERLTRSRWLLGDTLTEADIRLFTTLVRFDPVYAGHFKCNLRRLVDYPNLWGYTRALYQHPQIRPTVHFDHIRHHYYGSHPTINPSGIVPAGPLLDFDAPHLRDAAD